MTRSALHRCLQRHGISRLPDIEGDNPKRQRFKRSTVGFFHTAIAEVQTAEGKLYLFVAKQTTSSIGYQAEPPIDQRAGRTDEPHHQGSYRQTLHYESDEQWRAHLAYSMAA